MTEYRLKRIDPKNLVIQRKGQGKKDDYWKTIYYCGNNLKSLVRALLELTLIDYTPENKKLLDQVLALQLELVSGLERIEKLAREVIEND
jgi:hypothetical protein